MPNVQLKLMLVLLLALLSRLNDKHQGFVSATDPVLTVLLGDEVIWQGQMSKGKAKVAVAKPPSGRRYACVATMAGMMAFYTKFCDIGRTQERCDKISGLYPSCGLTTESHLSKPLWALLQGCQARAPVLTSSTAAKMSPRIRTSPEAVLADHAPPPSAAAATARRKPDQIPITGTEFFHR